ncbi:membrane protein [Beggiatoa sp. PS]|nr:membrane protein [Beggiatoa sp. PS]
MPHLDYLIFVVLNKMELPNLTGFKNLSGLIIVRYLLNATPKPKAKALDSKTTFQLILRSKKKPNEKSVFSVNLLYYIGIFYHWLCLGF